MPGTRRAGLFCSHVEFRIPALRAFFPASGAPGHGSRGFFLHAPCSGLRRRGCLLDLPGSADPATATATAGATALGGIGFGGSRGSAGVWRIGWLRRPASDSRAQHIRVLLAPYPRTAASFGAPGAWLRSTRSTVVPHGWGPDGREPDRRPAVVVPACAGDDGDWWWPAMRKEEASPAFAERSHDLKVREGRRALGVWRKQHRDVLRSLVGAMDGGAERCARPPGHGGPRRSRRSWLQTQQVRLPSGADALAPGPAGAAVPPGADALARAQQARRPPPKPALLLLKPQNRLLRPDPGSRSKVTGFPPARERRGGKCAVEIRKRVGEATPQRRAWRALTPPSTGPARRPGVPAAGAPPAGPGRLRGCRAGRTGSGPRPDGR